MGVKKILNKYPDFSFMIFKATVPDKNPIIQPQIFWRIKIMFGFHDFGGIQVPDSINWEDNLEKELKTTLEDYEVWKS